MLLAKLIRSGELDTASRLVDDSMPLCFDASVNSFLGVDGYPVLLTLRQAQNVPPALLRRVWEATECYSRPSVVSMLEVAVCDYQYRAATSVVSGFAAAAPHKSAIAEFLNRRDRLGVTLYVVFYVGCVRWCLP